MAKRRCLVRRRRQRGMPDKCAHRFTRARGSFWGGGGIQHSPHTPTQTPRDADTRKRVLVLPGGGGGGVTAGTTAHEIGHVLRRPDQRRVAWRSLFWHKQGVTLCWATGGNASFWGHKCLFRPPNLRGGGGRSLGSGCQLPPPPKLTVGRRPLGGRGRPKTRGVPPPASPTHHLITHAPRPPHGATQRPPPPTCQREPQISIPFQNDPQKKKAEAAPPPPPPPQGHPTPPPPPPYSPPTPWPRGAGHRLASPSWGRPPP